MSAGENIASLAQMAGIHPFYIDMQGRKQVTSSDTQRALLRAIGIRAANDEQVQTSLAELEREAVSVKFPTEVIVESDKPAILDFGSRYHWRLRSDDEPIDIATGIAGEKIALPALKSGVYELSVSRENYAQDIRILAAPRHLASIENVSGASHLWGINLALYGLSSKRNSGLGDFEDLAGFCQLAGAKGAAFVGINPIHNMGFSSDAISPYSPSHRGFLNTTHIALDNIPGLEACPLVREILNRHDMQISILNGAKEVPHSAHKAMHNEIIHELFLVFMEKAADQSKEQFFAFCHQGAQELERFAQFEVLVEENGPDWHHWRDTKTLSCDPLRVQFHMWLQWVADVQMASVEKRAHGAGLALGLYLDLAVGPRRSGAESWCEAASIAQGVSIGAPPDHLSPEGQNWDLCAFSPRKLQQQNYRPFRRILAQIMRHAGVVRIDHILGLNRSFWIPDDGSPGAYVTQPFESLMALIKIEAERHNCAVIGEDLGLVPNGFRETMRDHGFYGYSVLQYEKDKQGEFHDPKQGQAQVLFCFATHDTPTIKGYETGCDINWWQKLNWIDDSQASVAKRERAQDIAKLNEMIALDQDFSSSIHALLASSCAAMVSVQLDDILGVREAQNLPGTIDEHPNWRRKYDISLEELAHSSQLTQVSSIMSNARPSFVEETKL